MKTVTGFYRVKKYGTWMSFQLENVPEGLTGKELKEYCIENIPADEHGRTAKQVQELKAK